VPRIPFSKPSPGTVIALVALVVAVGGVAVAAIPDSNGTIHACYQKGNGSLRVVESAADCRGSENALQWSQNGDGAGLSAATGRSANLDEFFNDPPADPDPGPVATAQITLSAAGRLLVDTDASLGQTCPSSASGSCRVDMGVYVDGDPVQGSGTTVESPPGDGLSSRLPRHVLTDAVSAGTHTVSVRTKSNGQAEFATTVEISVIGPIDSP
jgi:hypothetical protein